MKVRDLMAKLAAIDPEKDVYVGIHDVNDPEDTDMCVGDEVALLVGWEYRYEQDDAPSYKTDGLLILTPQVRHFSYLWPK